MAEYIRPFYHPRPTPPPGSRNRIPSFLDKPVEEENPDEWDYEYSTTETETYYVTLDLTIPNAPPKRRTKVPNGRGGSRLRWINPGSKRATYAKPDYPPNNRRTKAHRGKSPTEGEELEEDVEGEELEEESDKESGDDATIEQRTPGPSVGSSMVKPRVLDWAAFTDILDVNGSTTRKKKQGPLSSVDTGEQSKREVQILDLHTHNPIVSYGGQVYNCRWSENTGTELLFTMHDSLNAHPFLRTLPDDVVLLGAISARITSRPGTMQTKRRRNESSGSEAVDSSNGYDPDLRIPIGMGASSRRKDQALFLQRLMELKEHRGEPDFVTVHAQKRLLNSQWRAKVKQLRSTERTRLRRLVRIKKRGWEAEQAEERLKEMDAEDKRRRTEDEKRGRDSNGELLTKSGRKSKRRKKGDLEEEEEDEDGGQGENRTKERVRRPIRSANLVKERFGIDILGGEANDDHCFHGDGDGGKAASTSRVRWAEDEISVGWQEGENEEEEDDEDEGEAMEALGEEDD